MKSCDNTDLDVVFKIWKYLWDNIPKCSHKYPKFMKFEYFLINEKIKPIEWPLPKLSKIIYISITE